MKDYNTNIVLSGIGTFLGISIVDVTNFLGLLITVINLAILVISLILKVIKYIKNDGKLDTEEVSDLVQDCTEVKKVIDSIEKEHDDDSIQKSTGTSTEE